MEQRILGRTGLKVSALGFGGAEIGFQGATQGEVTKLFAALHESGINLIDTAAAYLDSEKLIGGALGGRRKDVVLVTKCGAIEGFAKSDWSKEGILRTVQQSLRNLQTDYVDVLLLHSCSEIEMSMAEAVAGVEAARDAGYARYIGYSGDGGAAVWAARSGKFDVIETSCSLVDQEALELVLPVAREANLGVIIKRPLGNAVWRYQAPPENEYHTEYWRRWGKLKFPFAGGDPASIASIALRFVLGQSGVHSAIVGTTNPNRYRENIELLSAGPLDPSTLDTIRKCWADTADRSWVAQV